MIHKMHFERQFKILANPVDVIGECIDFGIRGDLVSDKSGSPPIIIRSACGENGIELCIGHIITSADMQGYGV